MRVTLSKDIATALSALNFKRTDCNRYELRDLTIRAVRVDEFSDLYSLVLSVDNRAVCVVRDAKHLYELCSELILNKKRGEG